jgi:hypothetical protein
MKTQQNLSILLSTKVRKKVPFKKIMGWIEECVNEAPHFKKAVSFFNHYFFKEGCFLKFDIDANNLWEQTVTIGLKSEKQPNKRSQALMRLV